MWNTAAARLANDPLHATVPSSLVRSCFCFEFPSLRPQARGITSWLTLDTGNFAVWKGMFVLFLKPRAIRNSRLFLKHHTGVIKGYSESMKLGIKLIFSFSITTNEYNLHLGLILPVCKFSKKKFFFLYIERNTLFWPQKKWEMQIFEITNLTRHRCRHYALRKILEY